MSEQKKYLRFPVPERIEHWVGVISFATLALTGLIQRFADAMLSETIIKLLGGIENVRVIHRIAAIILMVLAVYHVGAIAYKIFVKRSKMTMLPSLDDVKNAWDSILNNLNLKKTAPQQGRYTFDEKFEYWAFVWGAIMMGVTGFILWNPIISARILPGELIPAAKAAHGGEALLAFLAIIVWHLYNVHIKHFNKSMFTGYLTEEEMIEDHPLELADIKAGTAERPLSPETRARRMRIFVPIYSIIAVAMLAAIYFFVTFEETAIKTIPPLEDVVVFAPLTPTPFPTPRPTETPSAELPTSWNAGFSDLFTERCGQCHSSEAALGGLDVSTYGDLLAGGNSGPVIIIRDPDGSLIIIRQTQGDHPGQFSGDELALIREWIQDGAPEE
ncbi:MAG: hypothetical protein GTO18_03235 [Anaerolineales bacterium]|nr:hypothetical protein [Anaerolineales bacterium]